MHPNRSAHPTGPGHRRARTRLLAATGAATLLAAALLGLSGTGALPAPGAQADPTPSLTVTPDSGTLADLRAATVGANGPFTLTAAGIACPTTIFAGTATIHPALSMFIGTAPLVYDASNPQPLNIRMLAPFANQNDSIHTVDQTGSGTPIPSASIFPGPNWSALQPDGSVSLTSNGYLSDFWSSAPAAAGTLTAGTYVFGVVCADNSLQLNPDSNGNFVEVTTSITFDSSGNWTIGGAAAVTPVATTTTVSATLDTGTPDTADLSATVTQTTGSQVPTGTVQFLDGTTDVGSPVTIDGSGNAATTEPGLTPGSTHSYTAVFTPSDSTFSGSTSPTPAVVTDPAAAAVSTATALTATEDSTTATTADLTATVTAASGSAIPAGTVQFSDNGTAAGTAVTVDATGKATLADPGLDPGSSNSFTAAFTPTTTTAFSPSASSAHSVAIPPALTSGGTVTPGDTYLVTYPAATFGDGDSVDVTLNDPTDLGTVTTAADGSLVYTFDAPSSLAAGTAGTLVFTDAAGATPTTETVDFTVAGTAGTGTGNSTGGNSPVSFETGLVSHLVSTPGGIAGLSGTLVALAAIAAGGWLWLRRRTARTTPQVAGQDPAEEVL